MVLIPLLLYSFFVESVSSFNPRFFQLANFIPTWELPSFVSYLGSDGNKYPSNTIGIIKGNGWPAETHFIETKDGYLLEVHRIPANNDTYSEGKKKLPVLVMPGMFQSSADWVINSPANSSLAFILASNGYDVWLGNHRGSGPSNSHRTLKQSSSQFWDFSMDEMGLYDMPALIDYILKNHSPEAPQLHYITFSYSSAALLSGLSRPENKEYNAKIATGIVMGPSAFQENFLNGLVYYVSLSSRLINIMFNLVGTFPAIPSILAKSMNNFLPFFCNPRLDVIGICESVMRKIFGHDGGLITKDQIPLITSISPAVSGLKAIMHVIQLTGSRRFTPYDYGRTRNLELYGRTTPPDYNLTNVQAPIALFVGSYDYLAHREDAKKLARILPNLIEYYEAPYDKFTHLDFTYGREPAVKLYNHAIELMRARE